jgi:hypothetical protein
MARLKNGLLGNSSNKIGNIVTYVRGGRGYARSKNQTYNDKNSDKQKIYRSRMLQIVALGRLLLGVVRTGFTNKSSWQSGFNAFTMKNLTDTVFGVGTAVIDYLKVIVTDGIKLPVSLISANIAKTGHTCTVNWVPNSNGTTGLPGDIFQLVAYNSLKNECWIPTITATRSVGTVTNTTVPSNWEDSDTIEFYFWFKSAASETKLEVSKSVAHHEDMDS